MQEHFSFNGTQANSSSYPHNIASNYTQRHSNVSHHASIYDTNGNLGYGVGRFLREAFDYTYAAWQSWWHPAPTAEDLAQHRQAALYRKRLKAAIDQLELAIENLRKNPRAANSLARFKQTVKDSEKYLSPAPTKALRAYQSRLFNQLQNKVQHLKNNMHLRETVLTHLSILISEAAVFIDTSVPVITTEVVSNTESKRAILPPSSSTLVSSSTLLANFQTPFDLNSLDGSNGLVIKGLNANNQLGSSVSTASDLNSDGQADLVLGAPNSLSATASIYVIFGQASGWPAHFNLTTLNGMNGFAIEEINRGDKLGDSVSTAGDFNGDGQADLVLGASNSFSQAGSAYVIFGQASGWPAHFNLATLNGTNGFVIEGINARDNLGSSVSTAGDFNGDGKADLVLGAPLSLSGAGNAYVIFGQASGWPTHFNLTTLNGTNGFTIEEVSGGHFLGFSVSTAGDLNSDGKADLVLGAPFSFSETGGAYVIFGQASGWPAYFNLKTLNGTNGFAIKGVNGGDKLGSSVSTAGDLNGDGLADLVLGAPLSLSGAGSAYVIFGQASGWPAYFNLKTLNGTNGFMIEGVNGGDKVGSSVSTAGDLNGDGLADIILGAPTAAPGERRGAGSVYVIFGQASGWPARFNLATLNGINGFVIEGVNQGDNLGYSVSSAGHLNGDGLADLVVGAPNSFSNAGAAYVIFGKNLTEPKPAPELISFFYYMLGGSVAGGLLLLSGIGYGIKKCVSNPTTQKSQTEAAEQQPTINPYKPLFSSLSNQLLVSPTESDALMNEDEDRLKYAQKPW